MRSAARAPGGAGRKGIGPAIPPSCSGRGSGAFIGGGGGGTNAAAGADSGVLSGLNNEACDTVSTIGGGGGNRVSSSGGGPDDTDSFIGGGAENAIDCTTACEGDDAIAGGLSNAIDGGAGNSFVGAGNSNTVSAGAAAIASGYENNVSALEGFVGAGYTNKVSGEYGTVAGGYGNTASATESSIPGGAYNSAGGYASFAAGYHADADYAGSFVWSDNSASSTTKATAANEFLARAAGGVTFFTNSAMTTGVKVDPGSGTWSSVSDRNLKTGVEPINDATVLDRVASLPISKWSYISERGVRHLGPMAQDFYAAFGIGEDNKHITSIDEDGVALAAIKALHAENGGLRAQLAIQKAALATQQTQIKQLAAQVAALRSR
ncbi:MAG: tail fiber domain-containing protein [Candidatus Eremiobacteraeota bacterium]|nr:tail fiber domain-containing protein [Candidatus Eremiobacteraeota bacterium]